MKRFLFLIVGIVIGYILHLFIRIEPLENIAQSFKREPVFAQDEKQKTTEEPLDYIMYDGYSFNPSIMHMKYGDVLRIKNDSPDKLMWLKSEIPELNTPRGYGESEQITMRMYVEEGTYYVADINNEDILLEINISKNE